jgi:hypothetical protein
VEQEPAILVGLRQGLKLLHQLAGEVGASIPTSRLEDWGANRGPPLQGDLQGRAAVEDGRLRRWQRLRPLKKVLAHGLEGILLVTLHGHAAGIGRYACAEGVADSLALS